MLEALIQKGYGDKENYRCAERILTGADEVYGLSLSPEAIRFAADMGIGHTCGAVNAVVMVPGYRYSGEVGRASPRMRKWAVQFLNRFSGEMGSLLCASLKNAHGTGKEKRRPVIAKAAGLLEDIVAQELLDTGNIV